MVDTILKVDGLQKYFKVGNRQTLKAVDNVSFEIKQGEILGLVGESGCGKSTIGKTIVRLHKPTGGKILYKGQDINLMKGDVSTNYCTAVQMIFQNPYSTLNPRMTIGDIVGEGIRYYRKDLKEPEIKEKITDLLQMVGLDKNHYSRFPHEFSGGQRQRIGIARALSVNPEFIVCDEPISALDVSIQAQVVNLLLDLKEKMRLTYLFISHDLNIIKYISDRIIVMYLGRIVEIADASEGNIEWLHPYSQALISSAPIPDPRTERLRQRILLEGEIPSPTDPPNYCRFYARCPKAQDCCKNMPVPELKEVSPGHFVACLLHS